MTELQGADAHKRELHHTSCTFICQAYEQLRKAGIPASNIITIVQLRDYLAGLKKMAQAKPPPIAVEVLKRVYQQTKEAARLLLAEGGPNYDGEQVNPATVWRVLLGLASPSTPVVVDLSRATTLFFAIYSHGDSHPVQAPPSSSSLIVTRSSPLHGSLEAKAVDPLQHEWFCHFPYPNKELPELLACIATEGAKGKYRDNPDHYLYATQMRALLFQLFARYPQLPVVGLLNYCRSGGNLEFMRRPHSVSHFGADRWPFYLMSSSGAMENSLVGGLWTSFFQQLTSDVLVAADRRKTLHQLFAEVKAEFRRQNQYELLDLVRAHAYPNLGREIGQGRDGFHRDLQRVLCAGPDALPDFDALAQLQLDYAEGRRIKGRRIRICDPRNWPQPVDLPTQVRKVLAVIAVPEEIHGSDVHSSSVFDLFSFSSSSSL